MNDDENGDLHTSVYNLLMTSKSIAGDVTMARQLWRDHVNNDIELVIKQCYIIHASSYSYINIA